jgi:hypothetical protein
MEVCKSHLRQSMPARPILSRSGLVGKGHPGTTGAPVTPAPGTADTPEPAPPQESPLCCVQCLAPVAREGDRCQVAGAHRHVFANPHGFVFEIGCFSRAPGCTIRGPDTPDFSWFPGTRWQLALCARCGLHLGWRYTGHLDGPFYGLILSRLVASPDHG